MVRSFKVQNQDDLQQVNAQLAADYSGKLLLFRGQRTLHRHVRSGRARPGGKIHPDVEGGWCALAQQFLRLPAGSQHNGFVKAMLQHYGMATHYVDLTSDLQVALWFATHDHRVEQHRYWGSSLRGYLEGTYARASTGSGHILVLAVDSPEELKRNAKLFDLSQLPNEALRPHRQKAWLMLDRPPVVPEPDSFLVAQIEIDCAGFTCTKPTTELFPPPNEDAAYAHFLSLPYAQDPLGYYSHGENGGAWSEQDAAIDQFCAAYRALSLPEYVNEPTEELINHKWDDFTIYEPHPMRMWKNWRYPLEAAVHGVQGDIRDATKLTLTPSAKRILDRESEFPCSWPQLGNQGVFFTFATLDHDKVGGDGPPYFGVWLQRDDDLILEMPMESDEDVLTVCSGHGYFLRNGTVMRQQIKQSCACGNPTSHDERVSSVLRVSALVSAGKLILLPHPKCESLGWYLVLTGDDTVHLRPRVNKFHRAFKAAFKK